jgi:hypothetical protein
MDYNMKADRAKNIELFYDDQWIEDAVLTLGTIQFTERARTPCTAINILHN